MKHLLAKPTRYFPLGPRSTGAVFLATALAGCVTARPTTQTSQSQPSVVPTPDPNAIVWAIEKAPTSLDPARTVGDPAGTQIAAQVYDRLVRFRPGTVELAPGIATNWASDPEGRVYTFTLRDGLRFHDGTVLDAVAVVWNFERWMDKEQPEHNGDFVPWRDYFGGFVGEFDDNGRPANLVKRVEALDPRTVRIALHAPFAPFLHHLAMMPFALASPTAVRAQGELYGSDGAHLPVGSGPFRAVAWREDSVTLAPFAAYWAGAPLSPGLRFVVVSDPAERVAAVADGRAHGADLPATMDLGRELNSAGVVLVGRPPRSTAWLMLNHSRSPLGELEVRRAISLAIDRRKLTAEHFGSLAEPGLQLLPPGFLGFAPDIRLPEHNPAKAKRLLTEAGYGGGFKLNIWVATTARAYLPDPVGTAAAVASMLRAIGIDASVRSMNLRQFLMDRDRGRLAAWIIGWHAQSPDPDNFWFYHFGAGRIASEGQYQRPELAAALLGAQRTMATDERRAIYEEAARTVDADVARLFLAYSRPLVVVSKRVQGYAASPMGFDDFRDVTLVPSYGPTATVTAAGTAGQSTAADEDATRTAVTPTTAAGTTASPAAGASETAARGLRESHATGVVEPLATDTAGPAGTPSPVETPAPAGTGSPAGSPAPTGSGHQD